jgi:hypothetical protein
MKPEDMRFKWEYGFGPEGGVTLEELQKQVGPGWSKIIQEMAEDLFAMGWDGTVAQVKEKFGGLRFYVRFTGIPENLHRAAMAVESWHENQSYNYCEDCPPIKVGYRRRGEHGWIRTLCYECAVEKKFELKDFEKPKPKTDEPVR